MDERPEYETCRDCGKKMKHVIEHCPFFKDSCPLGDPKWDECVCLIHTCTGRK